MFYTVVNVPALNNLLQMFSNNMNLSGNKLPILVPPNTSSNMTSNSQHGNNRSLNIQEPQQMTLDSSRLTLSSNSNNTSYNNESSLLMCGPNTNGLPNTHLNPNSSLAATIATPSNTPYPPTMPPLYANNPNSLSNTATGKIEMMNKSF